MKIRHYEHWTKKPKMITKSISLDEETGEKIKELRAKNPNFNLSGFLRQALNGEANTLGESIAVNKKLLEDKRAQITLIEAEKEKLLADLISTDDLIRQLEIQQEVKKQASEKEKIEEAANKERREKLAIERRKVFNETFNEETGLEATDEIYNKWLICAEQGIYRNIWAFIEQYKQKNKLNGGKNEEVTKD
jgi:hypothetical protein